MADEAKLQWERRAGRAAAAAAFVGAALQTAAQLLQAAAFADRPDGDRGALIAIDGQSAEVLAAASTQALAVFFIAATLYVLFRAAAHRRELPPGFAAVIGLAPVATAVGLLWTQMGLVDVAADFASEGARSERRAEQLLEDRGQAPLFLALAGNIALAFSYVFISLNAMRTGLLSRFMGALGIVIGVLLVLPLLPGGPSIVQLFWLVAVGLLFLGRWPGGRGPAWESGRAEPWPTAAERRGLDRPAEERSEQRSDPEAEAPQRGEPRERPASRKRKRRR